MPIGDLRTVTNMGGRFKEDDNWKVYQHEVTPGSQTPVDAVEEEPPTFEEITPPKPKRKRRTKAQIEADKALKEANTKDLKDKGIK